MATRDYTDEGAEITPRPRTLSRSKKGVIQRALLDAMANRSLTAYDRTGIVRAQLHQLANADVGSDAYLSLSREGMRTVLSLCRLYFSVIECRALSTSDLIHLKKRYDLARKTRESNPHHARTGKFIQNWQIRHLQPLLYFYPFAFRNALDRAVRQATEHSGPFDRAAVVNELALAECGILLMKNAAIERRAAEARQQGGGARW